MHQVEGAIVRYPKVVPLRISNFVAAVDDDVPSASAPSPAGAGVMRVEAAGSLVAMLVPLLALTTWLVGASVEASSPAGGGWS